MKLVAYISFLSLLALMSSVRAQNYYADFSAYTTSGSTSQNNDIAFNPGSGITGTFNVSFVNTGTWASTTTSSPYFAYPFPGLVVPGNPTGADIPATYFSSFVSTNVPVGTPSIDFLAFKGAAGSTTTITFDFTGLSTGYLPAGSKLAWVDTDYGETTTIAGASGWYAGSGVVLLGDITNGTPTGTSESNPMLLFLSTDTTNPAQLVLTGLTGATDSPGAIITTALNLTSLTVTVASPLNSADYFQGFALAVVPEPSTLALCGLGTLLALARKRRRV